jgi:glucose 1-dehydrogenase
MRAVAVDPSRRELTLVEEPPPSLTSPTHVKLRMLEVGVCGTDREICAFAYGTPPAGSSHLVIGHESLAEVIEVGPAATQVRVGDLVVPTVRRPCPHARCLPCRSGRQDFCFTGDFSERGIKGLNGYMTEIVVDEERYMNVVPRALRDTAILVEPLTIAEKALIQVRQVQERLPWGQEGHRAVVLGAGPVGLLGAMALIQAGFDTWVYSREQASDPKAALVAAIGGHYASATDTTIDRLAAQVGNIDLVYEATGVSSVAFQMMTVLGTNGVFVFAGVPGRKGSHEVETDAIMRNLVLKNQIVLGTVNAGREAFENSVRDIGLFQQRWPKALGALITGRHPIEAYRDYLTGPLQGIKNVLTLA